MNATSQNSIKAYAVGYLAAGVAVCLYGAAAVVLDGCAGTVVPKAPAVRQASFDGTNQNSGFLGWTSDGSAVITSHARDRYNALVDAYGGRFAGPALRHDDGLQATATNAWIIDPQHLEYFDQMNRWRRAGTAPP